MIFIIKGVKTIVFIFIVISATFRPICPPAFFRCLLSKFLGRSSMISIIKGARTIVFIFIVISATFRPICPLAFTRCLLSKFLGRSSMISIIKVVRIIVFIVIVISITFRPIRPPAFEVIRSSEKVPEFNKHLKKAGGHIGRNVLEITIKIKTIVRKPLIIQI